MLTLTQEKPQIKEIISTYEIGWEESNVVLNVQKYFTVNFVNFPVYAKKKKDQKSGKVMSWRINKEELNQLENSDTKLGEDLRNGKIRYC